MKAPSIKLFSVVFLFTVTLFFVSCSQPPSLSGNVVQVDSLEDVQENKEVSSPIPEGVFCNKEKLTVKGRDAAGNMYEYKDECIGRVWYHSYTCEGNTFKASNQKCAEGCNLFGCEE